MTKWLLRPAVVGDKNYILKSWLKFARSQEPFCHYSPRAFNKYVARVHGVFGVCNTIVCHDPVDTSLIYGFVTFDPVLNVLHMVNVRKNFRQFGIGTALVGAAQTGAGPFIYTMHVPALKDYDLFTKWSLAAYDPYILEGEI